MGADGSNATTSANATAGYSAEGQSAPSAPPSVEGAAQRQQPGVESSMGGEISASAEATRRQPNPSRLLVEFSTAAGTGSSGQEARALDGQLTSPDGSQLPEAQR